jgi:outer membrane protein OmpA-like peptidoglycan-associated protein
MLKYLIILCLLPFICFSQNSKQEKQFAKALKLFHNQKYDECIEISQKLIKKDASFENGYLLLADCFSALKQDQKQTEILLQLTNNISKPRPQTFKVLAQLYYQSSQFEMSKEYINRYLENETKTAKRSQAVRLKSKIETALKLFNDSLAIQFETAPKQWTKQGAIYFIRISADDSLAIFTVRHHNGRFIQEDFFQSGKHENEWSDAIPAQGQLNTPMNEGAHCLSPDGKWLFFTACGRSDGYGRCDIYFSQKNGNSWSKPVNIGQPVNSAAWESQPALSANGRDLYFVSNRSGTIGGKDIWRSRIKGIDESGRPIMGKPVNLGTNINTPNDEMSPFIHFDNQHLYFSSNGHQTMGGLDIFTSKKRNGKWQKPQNIGYPINSIHDDSGYFVSTNAQQAWLTSDRKDEKLSLFRFKIPAEVAPAPTIFVKGSIHDKLQNPLFARVFITQLNNSNTDTIISNNNGQFLASLPKGKSYALTVQKKGFLFYSKHFQLSDTINIKEGYHLDITLEPIEVGSKMVLNNIFFEVNSAQLTVASNTELDRLLKLLQQNSSLQIEISGHTDNTGTSALNEQLSQNRAASVVKYLTSKGISATRLSYKGYGATMPVATNTTKEGRQQNRRTEIKITQQ